MMLEEIKNSSLALDHLLFAKSTAIPKTRRLAKKRNSDLFVNDKSASEIPWLPTERPLPINSNLWPELHGLYCFYKIQAPVSELFTTSSTMLRIPAEIFQQHLILVCHRRRAKTRISIQGL